MGGSKVRNTLLGVQLIAAIVMISGSLIINNQINFLKNKDLGFKQDNLLMIEIDNWIDKSEVVKSSFMQLVGVQSVSMISNSPGGQFNQHPLYLKDDPSQRIDVSEVFVDKESFETLGIEILEGRALDRTMAADSAGRSFVLNETAIKELGLEKGVGESIVWIDNENVVEGQIVGVVKDFHYKSLHVPIRPLIMLVRPRNYNYLIANVESNDYPALIKEMEQVYAKLYPEFDFEYKFLDQEIEALYKEESRTLILTSLLSGISIFLSTTGLVGLVIIAIKQRVREIGIRKVLGASISQILLLITNRFLIIGLVSTLIAVPITFILMRNWMSNFTYQNGISPLVFLLTALGLLMLIFITISMISLKTARSNQFLALRYE